MRFVQFEMDGKAGIGVQIGASLHGLVEGSEGFPGFLDELIAAGESALAKAGKVLAAAPMIDMTAARYLPPLRKPGKIICVGLNYKDHSAESGFKQPDYPTLFPRFVSSLIGHGDMMVRPTQSDTLDFEGEMVAVIGKAGKRIARSAALSHVAGYSIFNDGSVREYQFKAPQWTVGKNFDGTGAFGPSLVTSDELPAGGKGLRLETRLNGMVVQQANTDDMVFDLVTLISVISEAITLEPGDIIVTGTPSGVGHAREPRLYMKPGDVCEVEIERLGVLSNTIIDESASVRKVA